MKINTHEYFMNAALEEARKAFDRDEVPVGAVVVCNGIIVARAHNLNETLRDPTAHAEMQAITAAADWLGGKYLTDCTVYVSLEPCAMCAAALGWSRAGGLVYGARDEKKGYSLISDSLLHPRTKVRGGVLEKECREIMLRFFKKKRLSL
jgi:tRNA(adenine34) deaminase